MNPHLEAKKVVPKELIYDLESEELTAAEKLEGVNEEDEDDEDEEDKGDDDEGT
jgi:hypothetical protein